MRASRLRPRPSTLVLAVLAVFAPVALPAGAGTEEHPGFALEPVLDGGLSRATAVAFAPDGAIVVAEKAGVVKVFAGPGDREPTVAVDLSGRVYSGRDSGLLGLALDPRWPRPRGVYLLYTRDAPPGEEPPVWGDECPDRQRRHGCVLSGTLSRVVLGPAGRAARPEEILLEGFWCQQFDVHSVGDLVFAGDGTLLVSAGEGATHVTTDYGQFGGSADSPVPKNPCGDPPGGPGDDLEPPTAEGGALRAQDPNTPDDPPGYSGAVVSLDPDSVGSPPDDPHRGHPFSSPGPVAAATDDVRHLAFGLRNPFRLALHPATGDLWLVDVGWDRFEEINVLSRPGGGVVNFGWPCYEGPSPTPAWDNLDLDLCERLYDGTYPPAAAPYHAQLHGPGADGCYTAGFTALGFVPPDGPYPPRWRGALVFSDYFGCVWVAPPGAGGRPDFSRGLLVTAGDDVVTDIEAGPDGRLYLLTFDGLFRLVAGDETAPSGG